MFMLTVICSHFYSPPCRQFTPVLASVYSQLKEEGKPFEILFVSFDDDKSSFDEYHSSMPWLALPFDHQNAKQNLLMKYELSGIPTLVLLDRDGNTLTSRGRELIEGHGTIAYPFTSQRLAELKDAEAAKFQNFPKTITDPKHLHPLELRDSVYSGSYGCDGCGNGGTGWVYHCEECQYDLHPSCGFSQ
eukprot:TRINITY_DN2321_c0_g1_i6.p1 TRINITY_DN2321_c0_g1~~TRINITY_DN2321_c0_g1_i6.p1  ORF type:complete len:189 (-),score=15.25 TRINITY_DN2321_c0_g1_i6:59-625(-)